MRKAIISLAEGSMSQGRVGNIIEITQEAAMGFVLPDNTLMWDCGQYPVAIGDDWCDGVFTREGGALTPVPTPEQQLAEVQVLIGDQIEANIDLDYRLSMIELGLI